MFKDPVCGMMVDEKNAQHISEVGGKKVYLCYAACKSEFDKNPDKYGYQPLFLDNVAY
jgi:YHS domain-containing protein